jgi:hypothetical protein
MNPERKWKLPKASSNLLAQWISGLLVSEALQSQAAAAAPRMSDAAAGSGPHRT